MLHRNFQFGRVDYTNLLSLTCSETNLKSRQALPETAHMTTVESLKTLTGAIVKSELPNNKLYNFDGSLEINKQVYSLGPKQIVLRVRVTLHV